MSENPFASAAWRPHFLTPKEALAFLKRVTGQPENVLAGQLEDGLRTGQVDFNYSWLTQANARGARTKVIALDCENQSVTLDTGGPGFKDVPLMYERRTLELYAAELKRRGPPTLVSDPTSNLVGGQVMDGSASRAKRSRGQSFRADDAPLHLEMRDLIVTGRAKDATDAARAVLHNAKGKNREAKERRLREGYHRIWPRAESERGG
jgi:hypothetical protein